MRHGPHPPFLWTGHLEKQGNGNYENRNDSGFAADTAGGLDNLSTAQTDAMDENIKNAMGQIGVQLFSRYEAAIALLELLQPYGEELWKTARWLQEKRRTVTAETEPADASRTGRFAFGSTADFTGGSGALSGCARKIKTVEIIWTHWIAMEKCFRPAH